MSGSGSDVSEGSGSEERSMGLRDTVGGWRSQNSEASGRIRKFIPVLHFPFPLPFLLFFFDESFFIHVGVLTSSIVSRAVAEVGWFVEGRPVSGVEFLEQLVHHAIDVFVVPVR